MRADTSNVDMGVGPAVRSVEARESFAEFYQREVAGQVRRAALLTGSSESAHDVVHDAFVEVFRRWGTIAVPGAYLNRAVLNRCRDLARRRKIAVAAFQVDRSASPDYDPLWDALGHLSFNHRAAVVLRYYLQLTEAEIAAQLGCRPGSVGPWIQRGLRTLRKELS